MTTEQFLLLLFWVEYRQGWEEGLTKEEVRTMVHDHLANIGMDPHIPGLPHKWVKEMTGHG